MEGQTLVMKLCRPHPSHCAHCKMVQEYRDQRAAELDAYWNPTGNTDGFRDPNAWGRIITFKKWLTTYYRERRVEKEAALTMTKDTVAFPPLPEDDSSVYEGRRLILNRIDEGWGCDKPVWIGKDGMEYCEMPEHDPFTNRCYHHGISGHLPGGSI